MKKKQLILFTILILCLALFFTNNLVNQFMKEGFYSNINTEEQNKIDKMHNLIRVPGTNKNKIYEINT